MKVLLVDDHPLILAGLGLLIDSLLPGAEVLSCGTPHGMRALLNRHPDCGLVLLDLELADASGFELLAWIVERRPELPVVMLAASEAGADAIRAIDEGAMGFVSKTAQLETLAQALQLVLAGGIYVPPVGLDLGATARSRRAALQAAALAGGEWPQALQALGLTPRQKQMLDALLQGKTNKLIARELDLSVDTVKDHVTALFKVLGVNSRTQAVLAVAELSQSGRRP
ncbi:response regulator [Burkholderiaceae bacterium UC74_6]